MHRAGWKLLGGLALPSLAALLWWWAGSGTAPLPQPAPERTGAPDAARPAASAEAARAAEERRAARQALAGMEQALALLARGGGEPLSRRDALDLALDAEASLLERVRALRVLGRLGDVEALDVIERVLRGASEPGLLYQAARALGDSRSPGADRLLEELLAGPEGPAQRGAIAALGRRGGAEDIARLRDLLRDGEAPVERRQAAAAALAGQGGGGVAADLARVLEQAQDAALLEAALESLAARPWEEAEPSVRALLGRPELGPEREVALLEALSESSSGAVPLLLEYAAGGVRPAARRAAVESLALIEDAADVAGPLQALTAVEPDPRVRGELYQALALHADWETGAAAGALVERVLAEVDPTTRLHGTRMLAARLRSRPDAELARTLDRELVPWAARRAADPELAWHERALSLDSLKLAGTPEARDALADLAHSGDPAIAGPARKALEFPALR